MIPVPAEIVIGLIVFLAVSALLFGYDWRTSCRHPCQACQKEKLEKERQRKLEDEHREKQYQARLDENHMSYHRRYPGDFCPFCGSPPSKGD